MDNKKLYNKEIEDLFKAKESFRREPAKMPFEEKIRILVRLQKIANSIRKVSPKKGEERKVWEIVITQPPIIMNGSSPYSARSA